MPQGNTAEDHLNLLIDLQNYLGKPLAPYEEFMLSGESYYLSPGGFLHCKDSESEEVRGYFCGYLDNEVWNQLKTYLEIRSSVTSASRGAARYGSCRPTRLT